MKSLTLIGRILFSLIFLMAGFSHFSPQMTAYAQSAGVPMAAFLVPFSGIMAFVGALSIILGYKARWGAWLIVLFLLPITFMMHNFWTISDPMMKGMQMAMFMKNLAMMGGALLIANFGSGPYSLEKNKE